MLVFVPLQLALLEILSSVPVQWRCVVCCSFQKDAQSLGGDPAPFHVVGKVFEVTKVKSGAYGYVLSKFI